MNAPLTVPSNAQELLGPQQRLWTRDEYYQMADLGFFQGQKAELLEGIVMVMSPQKFPHYVTIDIVSDALKALFGSAAWVRSQAPMSFGSVSEPEPDVSVVPGRRQDYTDHPSSALLIVEVSETTLSYDRTRKASLYARMGVPDYWIVNLVNLQVEVYRTPVADAKEFYGFRYADVAIKRGGDALSPLAQAQAVLTAAALLP